MWVRDEWSASESAVRKAAAEAGDESPIVFVFLPRHESDRIRDALASSRRRRGDPSPAGPADRRGPGRAAGDGIAPRPRRGRASSPCSATSSPALASSREAAPSSPPRRRCATRVETAANRSLIRLFPKFAQGDNPNWGKVITKARDGAPDALDRRRPPRRADHAPRMQGSAGRDQPGGHQGQRPPEAVRRAAVRLAEGRRERGRPRPARGREHPRRPGREGSRRPEGAPADPDRQGHALQGGCAAERRRSASPCAGS